MVLELFSFNLCFLKCDVDRLVFLCIWEMNYNVEILKMKFIKSVINLKVFLIYVEVQLRIDLVNMNDDIIISFCGLNKLVKILKKRRIEKGVLILFFFEV